MYERNDSGKRALRRSSGRTARWLWRARHTLSALLILALVTFAAALWIRDRHVFQDPLFESMGAVAEAFSILTASPPESGNARHTYLRECTDDADRLLVTGSTPYLVNYYTRRPLAGGHLDWHVSLRADPERERQSLAILQRQSVPFVVSTSGPAMADFHAYPRIHAYLIEHYAEVPGTNASVLVDRRRQIVRQTTEGLPCFR